MGRHAKPLPPPRPNPLRNIREIREPTPMALRAAAEARANTPQLPKRQTRLTCPNKQCPAPQVEDDGVCHSCGTVVDDSNIVAELTFGETANGAAIVQGSYVGADQGGARSMGPGFGRGSGPDRETTVREGRRIMMAMANSFQIPEATVKTATQIFKMAAIQNFIQGRRMEAVAAVCLYTACRQEEECRIMLIDFADRLQTSVFKLGKVFKALHVAITLNRETLNVIYPEDLIYRFACKLEFGEKTPDVAKKATKLVQRMKLDWITVGRKPSGVCGAALIMAARMYNFRRTPSEVVYVVKVTSGTINKRLEEFKRTAIGDLTVDEFQHVTHPASEKIPPTLYEKTEEFLAAKKAKKRKRKVIDTGNDEDGEDAQGNKRQRTTEPESPATPAPALRRDADGFAIPPTPTSLQQDPSPTDANANIDPALLPSPTIDPALVPPPNPPEDPAETTATFEALVSEIGALYPEDVEPLTERVPPSKEDRRRFLKNIKAPDWNKIEQNLASQVHDEISDPHSDDYAIRYTQAVANSRLLVLRLEASNPSPAVSMDADIGEEEFADDPEVQNCVLPDAEITKKEKVWVNENKEWLRKMQFREWKKKQEEKGPKKATRNRIRKPRIGEGQKSAAESPAEAAKMVLKDRAWSSKLNYEALNGLFEDMPGNGGRKGMGLGSAATSRVTSRAGSVTGTSIDDLSSNSSASPTPTPTMPLVTAKNGKRDKHAMPLMRGVGEEEEDDDEEEYDSQHYVNVDGDGDEDGDEDGENEGEGEEMEDWKKGLGVAFAGTEVEEYVGGDDDDDAFAGLEDFEVDD